MLNQLGAIVRSEGDGQLAGSRNLEIGGLVLVAECVTGYDDRLGPAGHQTRHVAHHNRLAEDRAAQDVADGAVGGLPHLLETEFLDSGLIGGDGGALDTDMVLLDGVGGVDGHLVIGLVAVLDARS